MIVKVLRRDQRRYLGARELVKTRIEDSFCIGLARHSREVRDACTFLYHVCGLPKSMIPVAGLAGILHDIGKDEDFILFNIYGKFTRQQRQEKKDHVPKSVLLIENAIAKGRVSPHFIEIWPAVRFVVEHHHVVNDPAESYPQRYWREIPIQIRLMTLSDLASAYCQNRPSHGPRTLGKFMAFLVRKRGTFFTPEFTREIVDLIIDVNKPRYRGKINVPSVFRFREPILSGGLFLFKGDKGYKGLRGYQ